MFRMTRWLGPLIAVWGLLGIWVFPAQADDRIESFRARYDLQVGPLSVAQLEYTLDSAQDSYHYRLVSQPKGLAALLSGEVRNEEAWGRWQGNGHPQPLRYQRTENPGGSRAVTHMLSFDWSKKKLRMTGKDKDEEALPLPAHALDPMSEQLQLMQQVASGERGTIEHVVVNLKGIKHWRFRVGGKEQVQGPQGLVEAVRVDRIDQDNKQLTLWFAPALDHMLVRLQQKKKGKPMVTITLQQLTRDQKAG